MRGRGWAGSAQRLRHALCQTDGDTSGTNLAAALTVGHTHSAFSIKLLACSRCAWCLVLRRACIYSQLLPLVLLPVLHHSQPANASS